MTARMRTWMPVVWCAMVLSLAILPAQAQEHEAQEHAAPAQEAHVAPAPADASHEVPAHDMAAHGVEMVGENLGHPPLDYPHPTFSSKDIVWAGAAVIVILAMFLAAATVGPLARMHAEEELSPTHSHDEPPGASHHHGHGGTHDSHGH